MSEFVPVASYLSHQEAYPLAGRLRADGIDAQVIQQGDPLYPYRGYGGPGAVYSVIVPAHAADRARWILNRIDPPAVE